MIKKLRIKNFKSWPDTGDIDFSRLTGFFGTNSSGKTSILQLLLLLKQTAESPDRALALDLGNERSYLELGTFKDIIFRHDIREALGFDIDWDLTASYKIDDPEEKGKSIFEGRELGFKAKIRQTDRGRVFVEEMSYRFDGFNFLVQKKKKDEYIYRLSAAPITDSDKKSDKKVDKKFVFRRTQGRQWDLPSPIKFYGFPDQVKAYYKNADFLSDFQLKFEELFSNVYYLGPLREYPKRQYVSTGSRPTDMGRRGEQVIDALLASRAGGKRISRGKGRKKLTVEEYVAYWLKELGLINSFRVSELVEGGNLYQVKVKLTAQSSEVLITDVGFGVSQILPVLTLCYYVPEGSTLLIEQPEIHLHPKVQAGLADVFIDAIRYKNIRIILESHSEHLLRRLQRRIAEEQLDHDDAALYFCEPRAGGSALKKLQLDLFGNISNWPPHFFGDEMGELAAISEAVYKRKRKT